MTMETFTLPAGRVAVYSPFYKNPDPTLRHQRSPFYLSPGAAWAAHPKCDVLRRGDVPADCCLDVDPNDFEVKISLKIAMVLTPWAPKCPPDNVEQLIKIATEYDPRIKKHLKKTSIHGPDHWKRVNHWGMLLCERTPRASVRVVQMFSLLHDLFRLTDDDDPEHGKRAALFLRCNTVHGLALRRLLGISRGAAFEDVMDWLYTALVYHSEGRTHENPTIGVCWDADRYDLTRTCEVPDPDLFSTPAAKELLWKL